MAQNVAPPPAREQFLLNNYTAPAWLLFFNQMWAVVTQNYAQLTDAADDTAAAAAGVKIGQLYRTGSIIKARIT